MGGPEERDEEPESGDITREASSITDTSFASAVLRRVTSLVNHIDKSSGCSRSEGEVHFCIVPSKARRGMMSV